MGNKILLLVGVIIILLLGAGAYLLFSNNSSPQVQTPNLSPTAAEQKEPTASTKTSEITLSSSGFSPNEVTIEKGTTVIWTNNSGKDATVDSNPHPVHTSHPEMNLGSFGDGETLEFTYQNPGEYNYHNHFNPEQTGTIIVE